MVYLNQFHNGIATGDYLMSEWQVAYAKGVDARKPGKFSIWEGLENVPDYGVITENNNVITAWFEEYFHIGREKDNNNEFGMYRMPAYAQDPLEFLGQVTEGTVGASNAYGAKNLLRAGDYYVWFYPYSNGEARMGRIKFSDAQDSTNWVWEDSFESNALEYDKWQSDETIQNRERTRDFYFPTLVYNKNTVLFTWGNSDTSNVIYHVNVDEETPSAFELLEVNWRITAMSFQSWNLRIYTSEGKLYTLTREQVDAAILWSEKLTSYDTEVDLGIRSVDSVYNDGDLDYVLDFNAGETTMLEASGTDRQIFKKSQLMDNGDFKFLFITPSTQDDGTFGIKYQDLLFVSASTGEGWVYTIGKEDPEYNNTIYNSIWWGEDQIRRVNYMWRDWQSLYVQYNGENNLEHLGKYNLQQGVTLYQSQAELWTPVFDFSQHGFNIPQVNLKANIPENTSIEVQYRYDGGDFQTLTTFLPNSNGGFNYRTDKNIEGSVVQYKLILRTDDTSVSPYVIGMPFTVLPAYINE